MTIVPFVSAEHLVDTLAVPLPRYAQIVDYQEAAFFGVNQTIPQGGREYTCRTIWSRWQRQAITRALMAAQGEFWKNCNYPFVPTYISLERHEYTKTLLLNNCNVIGLGEKVDTMLVAGKVVNHASDPVSFTVNSAVITDPAEVHIFHPGTDYEINPSSVTIAGGVITVEIPRVRMVAIAYDDNPIDGWDYTDTSYFEATVDVRRIYLDDTHQVYLSGMQGCPGFGGTWAHNWQDAYLPNKSIGHLRMAQPSLSNCDFYPRFAEVNYLCGLTSLSQHAEDAIVRLAHARMPSEPCGCDFLKGMWERDKYIPDVLDSERENCPFGMSDGAWQAWCFLQDLRCYRGRAI